MSQEDVEVVRRAFAYEIYGVGDRAEAEAIFDPNEAGSRSMAASMRSIPCATARWSASTNT
jgi:hypothetical protein